MNPAYRLKLTAFALLAGLAACQSRPPDGAYTQFVSELMVESARMKKDGGEGPERAENAVRAVSAWRGSDAESSAN